MIEAFEFSDGGRTYSCYVERLGGPDSEAWWWFEATNESHRFAAFRANSRDTRESVRERTTAYHRNLLARRAEPPAQRWHGRPGQKPGQKPGPQQQQPPK